jgi:hypothetical protein
MKRLLLGNLVAIQLMILSHAALAGLYTIDPWYVDLINLPVGSRISLLLIFGYWVLPGLFIGTALSFTIFSVLGYDTGFGFDLGVNLVDCLAPAVALMAMHFFRLSSFFTSEKFVISHILFLALITSFVITLSRFILIFDKAAYAQDGIATFFFTNLFGSMIGALTFFFMAILMEFGVQRQMRGS